MHSYLQDSVCVCSVLDWTALGWCLTVEWFYRCFKPIIQFDLVNCWQVPVQFLLQGIDFWNGNRMYLQSGRMTDVWMEVYCICHSGDFRGTLCMGNQSLSDRPTIVGSSLATFHVKMKAHPRPSNFFFFSFFLSPPSVAYKASCRWCVCWFVYIHVIVFCTQW